eukprot:13799345-Alexandrium_andersonii.AAC.1
MAWAWKSLSIESRCARERVRGALCLLSRACRACTPPQPFLDDLGLPCRGGGSCGRVSRVVAGAGMNLPRW